MRISRRVVGVIGILRILEVELKWIVFVFIFGRLWMVVIIMFLYLGLGILVVIWCLVVV